MTFSSILFIQNLKKKKSFFSVSDNISADYSLKHIKSVVGQSPTQEVPSISNRVWELHRPEGLIHDR